MARPRGSCPHGAQHREALAITPVLAHLITFVEDHPQVFSGWPSHTCYHFDLDAARLEKVRWLVALPMKAEHAFEQVSRAVAIVRLRRRAALRQVLARVGTC